MEKTTTRTNETVTVNVNLDAFIIPNKANRAGDWFLQSDRERHATIGKRVAEAANKPYNTETDKLVQLWFTGEGCDNFCDHGMTVTDTNGKNRRLNGHDFEYLPATLFFGMREGDQIQLTLPITQRHRGKDDTMEILVNATVTLNQLGYRYRGFGKFEDVLANVVA